MLSYFCSDMIHFALMAVSNTEGKEQRLTEF